MPYKCKLYKTSVDVLSHQNRGINLFEHGPWQTYVALSKSYFAVLVDTLLGSMSRTLKFLATTISGLIFNTCLAVYLTVMVQHFLGTVLKRSNCSTPFLLRGRCNRRRRNKKEYMSCTAALFYCGTPSPYAAVDYLLRRPHLAAPIAAPVQILPQFKRFYTTPIFINLEMV